jgi:diadenosine tetraphosphate (Ap4A) HIT family hydrolase
MKLLKKTPRSFFELPEKKQNELLLKAAKSANKQQKTLETRYLKLQTQK